MHNWKFPLTWCKDCKKTLTEKVVEYDMVQNPSPPVHHHHEMCDFCSERLVMTRVFEAVIALQGVVSVEQIVAIMVYDDVALFYVELDHKWAKLTGVFGDETGNYITLEAGEGDHYDTALTVKGFEQWQIFSGTISKETLYLALVKKYK